MNSLNHEKNDEYNYIYGNIKNNTSDSLDSECDYCDIDEIGELYEDVYDEDGNLAVVECNNCGTEIKWRDGEYICPNCQTVMDRKDFFECIGAELPGIKCLVCDNLYPGCIVCSFGYCLDN